MEQENHKVRIRIRSSQENWADTENESAQSAAWTGEQAYTSCVTEGMSVCKDDLEAEQNDQKEKTEIDENETEKTEMDKNETEKSEMDKNETEKTEMETILLGKYYKKNGRHYLFYEELIEGTDRMTSNRVIIAPDRMELVRKGAVNTVMTFEPGRMVREDYHTPYGTLTMGIDTQKLLLCENEDGLLIQTEYLLEINGAYASFNKMEFRVGF